jgi:predicted metal-dependent HD superfamily phosphohydrolase
MDDEQPEYETYADYLRAMIAWQTRPELRALLQQFLKEELERNAMYSAISGSSSESMH